MINALFSSRENGTKGFELDGVTFGWHAITALYERECDRIHRGLTRMVPKLKEVHIIRDSWTKLNITPAKIMQVCTYTIYYGVPNGTKFTLQTPLFIFRKKLMSPHI